ncbi:MULTISPECIES: hypothetical protein [unclassified Ruegeria]|uniref:hypothetical protein n=1 Tax=unclassified Ruegeria TaxID=2625375 RepID=UPI0014922A8E|nr:MULTISPECIES: hypothetical protein [unclassified Ruegeria]NOD87902.1 hypothetical protein [Ruegeria sp. HKCCD4318]NOE14272.1 hypothetical protein [Ruegeria sp. HKCCD4318-2]NOG08371.1 hypothetical protein [Ruegeria sp. HKCCD4315]
MTLTVKTAPTAARKLVKSTGFIRRSLDQASRSEQDNVTGAREERIRVTAKFTADLHDARQAITDTEARAAQYELACHVLRTGSIPTSTRRQSGIVAHASRMVRFGASQAQRDAAADRLTMAATAARSSADKAQTRMDAADADLMATTKLADYLAALAKHDFKKEHPLVRKAQKTYTAWKTISK